MAVQERRSVRQLYLYLVCLITLVIALFALVSAVRAVTNLVYPSPTAKTVVPGPAVPGGAVGAAPVPAYGPNQGYVDYQRHDAVLSLVGALATLAVAGPLYAYHWRQVQKEHPPAEPSE